jgi:hypothetical protein
MKKQINTICTCLLLTIVIILASCSNEVTYQVQPPKVSNAQVIKKLQNVNLELISTVPAETRGWRRWSLKQRMNVITADIGGAWGGGKIGGRIGGWVGMGCGNPITGCVFGAAVGAIVGGAYGSWLASPGTRAISTTNNSISIEKACKILMNDDMSINESAIKITDRTINNKLDVDKKLLIESKLDDNSLNIGKVHNLILSVMDGTVVLQNKDQTQPDSSNIKEALFNSDKLIDSCKVAGTEASIGHFSTSDAMLSKVMELFNQVLEEYASKTDDVAFIVSKYVDVIENSNELTAEQKKSIKSGLATALYSSKYWELTSDESIK